MAFLIYHILYNTLAVCNHEYCQLKVCLFVLSVVPGVPEDAIALRTRYMNGSCFITALWQSPENNHQARITHYNISVNRSFILSKTANSNTTSFSSSFAITCGSSHTVDISAGNICAIGQNATYLIQDQNEQCPINIDMILEDCFVTEAPTQVTYDSTSIHGGSDQINGNGKITILG